MPSYTVYCSRIDSETFGWASMIPLSHLSFLQCEKVKFQPKKKVKINIFYNVVKNFCNIFNLISFFYF